jgi:hypothetical protein
MSRWEDTVAVAVYNRWVDTTYGLGKRCAAVNTSYGDAYRLPTVWTVRDVQGNTPQFSHPYAEIYTQGSREFDPMVEVGSDLYEVNVEILNWLSPIDTSSDPVAANTLYRRLATAIWEILTERDRGMGGRWDGRTLQGAVQHVYGINVSPVRQMPRFGGGADMGSIGAQVTFTATVAESDLSTG